MNLFEKIAELTPEEEQRLQELKERHKDIKSSIDNTLGYVNYMNKSGRKHHDMYQQGVLQAQRSGENTPENAALKATNWARDMDKHLYYQLRRGQKHIREARKVREQIRALEALKKMAR